MLKTKQLLKLSLINIKRTKIRSILTASTIIIGITSLFLILTLNAGLKKAVFTTAKQKNPLNQITVYPPASNNIISSVIGAIKNKKINNQSIEEIKKLPHVENIYLETAYIKPSTLEIPIFGRTLQTDSMVFGVPYEFIQEDIKNKEAWTNPKSPYPAIISRKLLDIYNLSVAQTQGIPEITQDLIIGREIDVFLGHSSFFESPSAKKKATNIKVKVIGLSNKTNIVGITLPLKTVNSLNHKKDPSHKNQYINAYVIADSPQNVDQIAKTIEEKLKLETKYLQKTYSQIKSNFTYLTIGLGLISFIILCVSALSITNSFFTNINERVNEIGILRALGASKKVIKKLFLTEAALLGTISGILGVTVGTLLIPLINSATLSILPDISTKPDSIFFIDYKLYILLPIFSLFFSQIAAYLPAHTAAKMNTIRALNK